MGALPVALARAGRLLAVLARNERTTRVPETLPCPLLAVQNEQADLGKRAGGVVTPASRVAKLGVGSTGGPPSHPLFRQLVLRKIPAYRTAGQSKRARSGVSRTPRRSAGDARKHHGIAPHRASQISRLLAASSVAFVPGVPQLGCPARPHGAGVAQGGGLRDDGGAQRGTGTCSRAHRSSAPS
jgi:hypothetical protein